jgi:hypothetical protein
MRIVIGRDSSGKSRAFWISSHNPPRREFHPVFFEVRKRLHDLLRVVAMKDAIGLCV